MPTNTVFFCGLWFQKYEYHIVELIEVAHSHDQGQPSNSIETKTDPDKEMVEIIGQKHLDLCGTSSLKHQNLNSSCSDI